LAGWSVDVLRSGTKSKKPAEKSSSWETKDGELIGHSENGLKTRSYLLTDQEYDNFKLQFEYKPEIRSEAAVVIRGSPGEMVVNSGRKIFGHPQIKLRPDDALQSTLGTSEWLCDGQSRPTPPFASVPCRPGDWHHVEVIVQGQTCFASLDGIKIADLKFKQNPGRTVRTNSSFHPGLARIRGVVGFEAHTGTVSFKDIRIQVLAPADSPAKSEE
jgi:hypothetical protein